MPSESSTAEGQAKEFPSESRTFLEGEKELPSESRTTKIESTAGADPPRAPIPPKRPIPPTPSLLARGDNNVVGVAGSSPGGSQEKVAGRPGGFRVYVPTERSVVFVPVT